MSVKIPNNPSEPFPILFQAPRSLGVHGQPRLVLRGPCGSRQRRSSLRHPEIRPEGEAGEAGPAGDDDERRVGHLHQEHPGNGARFLNQGETTTFNFYYNWRGAVA